MKITLDYKQYLSLITSVGELQGMVKGLSDHYSIPLEVKERVTRALHTIEGRLETLQCSEKEYPDYTPL